MRCFFDRLGLSAGVLTLLLTLLLGVAPLAHATRNFAVRYAINTNGGLSLIGNSQMTCPATDTNCAALQNSGPLQATTNNNLNNNNHAGVNIDVDSDPTTFNSTTANLNIPSGSTVLFAGLYWSALYTASASSTAGQTCPPCTQVLFQTPATAGYTTINAAVYDTADNGTYPPASGGQSTRGYQGFADVTALVAAAGNGTYAVANLTQEVGNCTLYTNTNCNWGANGDQGGWTLVVVYGNTSLPLRNLTVFDGFEFVANGSPITESVSGFLTPLSGPVSTRLGIVTYDGDRGTLNDTFALNGTQLSDNAHLANNFYNSAIAEFGADMSNRNPDYNDNYGFDIAHVNVPNGVLGNGATSATIVSQNTGDQYWLGVLTFDTNLYVPIITPNLVKTATNVSGGPLTAGSDLRWNISMNNTGIDTATNLTLTDPIPTGVTYLPGSLVINTGANSGTKTDASGDDQAEYTSSGAPKVTFRLGTGANSTNGGLLPFGAATSLQFDTIVNSGLAAGTTILNTATIAYKGQTIGTTFAGAAAASPQVVESGPQISKSFSPNPVSPNGATVMSIVLSNPAANPSTLTGVGFSDTYPTGMTNTASPSPQITCTSGSTAGTLSGGLANGNFIGMSGATIAVGGNCTVTVNITATTTGNYVNTTGAPSSSNGGSGTAASATLSVGTPSISKSFSPTSILVGGTSTVSFTLTNSTAVNLTGVSFSDPLTTITVAGTPAVSNTCGGTVTAVANGSSISLSGGTLNANSSCTVSVNVTSSSGGVFNNTTTGVNSTQTGVAGNPSNTASLTVVAPPTITKTFAHASEQPNQPSPMTIVVTNPNTATTITGVAFTDTYPTGLVNYTPANVTLNCSSGSSATLVGGASGGSTVGISGGSLAPGGTCTINADVTGTTTGSKVNSTGSVTTTNAGTGSAASATLVISALTPPTATKTFAASSIASGGNTTMTITLTNSNGSAVTGVAFTDNYPTNFFNAATPALTNTCGGTATAAGGGSSLALTGGTIPANGSCALSVSVTSNVSADYLNSTGSITTGNAGSFGPVTGLLTVLQPPAITKTFNPVSIAASTGATTSTLTISLSNPTNTSVSLTGVNVTDSFPTNLVVGTTPATTNTCGGTYTNTSNTAIAAGNTGIQITGVTLAAHATCSFSVAVSSNIAGSYTNTTGNVGTSNAGTGGNASATLGVARPTVAKAFGTSPIASGATSVLTITLTNPTASAMTAAAFTDTYPSGMTNTATPAGATTCTGGTVTAAASGGSVSLSGGTIPANGTCTVTVNTTSTQTVINTIAAGALTVSGGGSNPAQASATLQVYVQPTVAKSFSPVTILPGGSSVMTITLTNTNSVAATTTAFTDTYPSGLVNAATPALTNTCGGTATATAGAGSLTLSGGTIPANSSCSLTVAVTSSTAATYTNSTGSVTTANIGTGSAASATLTVMAAPTVSKAFSPTSQVVSATSRLSITLTNSNTVAITGAAFTDTYPSGLVNTSSPNATSSCTGGTVTAAANGGSLALSGATIPASGSCVISVNVTSATAGSYVNNTGAVTTTNAGTGTSASATLTVTVLQPNLSVTKLVSVFSDPVNTTTRPKSIPGALESYSITVTNLGLGTVDSNSLVITDPIPANTKLYVGDIGVAGSGPVQFSNGSTSSSLTYTYTSLSSTTDNLDFSNNNGSTWTYTPTADANGYDTAVTNIRIRPQGSMAAAAATNPSFTVTFRVGVK